MNKDDVFVLIIVLFINAIIITPAIYSCIKETKSNKYCFEKYQNLEDIKTCKDIFYKWITTKKLKIWV